MQATSVLARCTELQWSWENGAYRDWRRASHRRPHRHDAAVGPMRISITLSDPWGLGEALKWQPLRGEWLRVMRNDHGGHALIALDACLIYLDSKYR